MDGRPLIVSVNLTTACNLACTYCHAIHRLANIGEADLAATARGAGALDEPVQVVPFGGEPLVAWDKFQRLVEQSEAAGVREFLLCTNGLLAGDDRIDYFNRHNVEVTISWDGVPAANDKLRIYPKGEGSSADLELIFDRLRAIYEDRLNIRITVGADTARHFGDSVRYIFERLGDRPGVKLCFMPVSTDDWSPEQLADLERGIAAAADATIAGRRRGHDVAFAYNECIRAHELGDQILFEDDEHAHACLWGTKMLGVDTDGGVFPCHTVIELRAEQKAPLRLGEIADGIPDLARRRELMPPPAGNPYHSCYAWNVARCGDPNDTAEVYRVAYRAFIRESVRTVAALEPARAAAAAERAEQLLARAARWDAEQGRTGR